MGVNGACRLRLGPVPPRLEETETQIERVGVNGACRLRLGPVPPRLEETETRIERVGVNGACRLRLGPVPPRLEETETRRERVGEGVGVKEACQQSVRYPSREAHGEGTSSRAPEHDKTDGRKRKVKTNFPLTR